jgi:hypothetical protein
MVANRPSSGEGHPIQTVRLVRIALGRGDVAQQEPYASDRGGVLEVKEALEAAFATTSRQALVAAPVRDASENPLGARRGDAAAKVFEPSQLGTK